MNALRQIAAVVGMNTRALGTRMGGSLVVVVGMAAVVAITLFVLSLGAGGIQMAQLGSSPDRVVVLSQGAQAEGASSISRHMLAAIADTPGIRKDADGKPLISAEMNANFFANKRSNGVEVYVPVRGVAVNIFEVRPTFRLTEGRMFTPGLRELIVGKRALALFEGVEIGKDVMLQDGPWTIVGAFESTVGTDNNLMGDANTLLTALRRHAFNILVVQLEDGSESHRSQFIAALKSNPAISVEAESEESYRLRMTRNASANLYTILAYGVGAIMAIGAVVAALITMYAAVAARAAEIATLRAIGFGASAVVISVLVEALLLAVVGALVGALAVWQAFDGHRHEVGFVAITQVVTPQMIVGGVVLALVVGTIGALFPAIRAARLPIATALQVR